MKQSLKSSIFDIFDADDTEVINEHTMHQEVIPPRVILYSSVPAIKNYFLLDELYRNKHGKKYIEVAKEIKHEHFLKIHTTLEAIQEKDYELAVDFPLEQDAKDVITALKFLQEYFVSKECYEQCISISKLLMLLNKCK